MDRFQSEPYATGTAAHAQRIWGDDTKSNLENPWDEPVEAVIVSACCSAGIRLEAYDYGTCPESGYHDKGDRYVCVACGDETEPEVKPVEPIVRKPVVRMQGELNFSEVA